MKTNNPLVQRKTSHTLPSLTPQIYGTLLS
uniref:Uncharacterized protein n=1 Tax=Anguilla anguilla TaxID=7936 RepID=A0A0E9TKY6_ANGAN